MQPKKDDGCPKCKKKNTPKPSPSATQPKKPMKDMQVKPDGSVVPYKDKKPPKKLPKIDWCVLFKQKKGDQGSERSSLGVPQTTKIAVDMKLKDMDKLCTEPEKKPKAIVDRLKKYNDTLEKMLNLDAEEKEVLAKSMRDSYTLKLVQGAKKKLDKLTWQIIMNMDMYRQYLNQKSGDINIKNMILAQNNGYDLCSGLVVNGRAR